MNERFPDTSCVSGKRERAAAKVWRDQDQSYRALSHGSHSRRLQRKDGQALKKLDAT
jgi:hypothetical protein